MLAPRRLPCLPLPLLWAASKTRLARYETKQQRNRQADL